MAFPELCPSRRVFTDVRWPVRSVESLSGVTSRRLFGNFPSKAELVLEFQNISDENALAIVAAHRGAMGTLNGAGLPAAVLEGMNDGLDGAISQLGDAGMTWHWAEPPVVTSTFVGRSTVSCRFEATQDA